MWWPRGQKEVADPTGSQEAHLTEEKEGDVGYEVAGTLRIGHTCTQRPQLHTTAAQASRDPPTGVHTGP